MKGNDDSVFQQNESQNCVEVSPEIISIPWPGGRLRKNITKLRHSYENGASFPANYEQKTKLNVKIQKNSEENDLKSSKILGDQKPRNTTLGVLTKQFVRLIKSQKDQTIDISDAANKLEVQKRRIYDITNVLEGIGYIAKIEKNKMKWLGATTQEKNQKEINKIDMKIKYYEQKCAKLSESYSCLTKLINDQFSQICKLNYITYDDLMCFMTGHKIETVLVYEGCEGGNVECGMGQEALTVQIVIQAPEEKNTKIYHVKNKQTSSDEKGALSLKQNTGQEQTNLSKEECKSQSRCN